MAYRNTLLALTSLFILSHNYSHLNTSKHQATDYDVAVIGGGSGGLAFSFQAKKLGLSTVVFDYMDSTIHGTKWGVGGTCVNAGCTPKKLLHHAAILGQHVLDATDYGWDLDGVKRGDEVCFRKKFNWEKLIQRVNLYVKSLNFMYKNDFEHENIKYINAFATLINKNTIFYASDKQLIKKYIQTGELPQITSNSKKSGILKVKNIVIATGGKPSSLNIEGKELAITSDDIFWRKTEPGKTLIVGGGYVSMEIAGFLTEFGYHTTMMTRSGYLSNFDQDMVNMVVKDLKQRRVHMIENSTLKEMKKECEQIVVKYCKVGSEDDCRTEKYDTVLFAVGRKANTEWLNLDKIGIKVNKKNNKIITQEKEVEYTGVDGVYALGDVVNGIPQLTSTVTKAGPLLARRIAHRLQTTKLTEPQLAKSFVDFKDYPTTVFTPLEYSVCGLSEQQAIKKYGKDKLAVYHSEFLPLQQNLLKKFDQEGTDYKMYCYVKVICGDEGKVLGLHYVGPNAGEVMQGYAVAMRMGLNKEDLERTMGIHPTDSEELVKVKALKYSGENYKKKGCCG